MVENCSIAAALLFIGCCLFVRRSAWRCKLDRALTVSVVLIFAGVALTSPWLSDLDEQLLITSVGVQHFDDYLGHICFLSALATIAYAIIARTVPDASIARLMRRRVEYPIAAAALIMLILVTSSPRLRSGVRLRPDFFEVYCGQYLHAYWTIYASVLLYLLGYIFRLLLVLRQDPRSRRIAHLYIATCVLGMIGTLAEWVDTWFHFVDGTLWLLITVPAVLASVTSALSWRRQRRRDRTSAEHCDTPPGTPKIPT